MFAGAAPQLTKLGAVVKKTKVLLFFVEFIADKITVKCIAAIHPDGSSSQIILLLV